MNENAEAYFTTYHHRHRHPVGHHRQKRNDHTGNGPSCKNGHSRSHAYYVRGTGSDREDHHHSHTLTRRRMHHLHNAAGAAVVAALVPARTHVSTSNRARKKGFHLLLGIADIGDTHLVAVLAPEIWMISEILRQPSSGDASAAPSPDRST